MKISKVSRVLSLTKKSQQWTAKDDFTLQMMVGKASYAQIGLMLGRKAGAVQRRASRLGLSARSEVREGAQTSHRLSKARREAVLSLPEDDLAQFLPSEVAEPPVAPIPGSRAYHREYKRQQRSVDNCQPDSHTGDNESLTGGEHGD